MTWLKSLQERQTNSILQQQQQQKPKQLEGELNHLNLHSNGLRRARRMMRSRRQLDDREQIKLFALKEEHDQNHWPGESVNVKLDQEEEEEEATNRLINDKQQVRSISADIKRAQTNTTPFKQDNKQLDATARSPSSRQSCQDAADNKMTPIKMNSRQASSAASQELELEQQSDCYLQHPTRLVKFTSATISSLNCCIKPETTTTTTTTKRRNERTTFAPITRANNNNNNNVTATRLFGQVVGRKQSSLSLFIANCSIIIIIISLAHLLLMSSLTSHIKFVAAAASEQQYFEHQPEAQRAIALGADTRLRCLVRNRQGECAWLRNGRIVGNIARKYHYAKAPTNGDCSIEIRNASVALDDGHWQCQVMSPDVDQDALQTRDSHLIVMVAPEKPQIKNLSPGSAKLIVEENKPKVVSCEMRGGNPAAQIEWFLDGRNITKEASQTSTMTNGQRLTQSKIRLAEPKRSMNGKNLTCVGVHPTLNQSTSVELDVQYVPSVSVVQREYSIVEGSPLSISCQVDANPAPTLINWRLVNDGSQRARAGGAGNKEALMVNKQGPVLEFVRIGREYNQNTFECLAQNALGVSSPADVRLNVLYTPFLLNTTSSGSIALNDEARLSCLFDGNPAPEIKWFYTDPLSRTATALQVDAQQQQQQHTSTLSKEQKLEQQQQLNIRNVSYRNEGDYHCEARNSINGETYAVRSSNIALDIYGEPQFLLGRAPHFAKAVQGSKSDIALTFCSDPQPQRVYWQFGSIRLEVRSQYLVGMQNNGAGAAAAAANHLAAGQQATAASLQAPPPAGGRHGPTSATAHVMQRFQVHPLVPLQKRDSSFSKVPTCFEAQLTLLDPELSDQRDYNLFVQNERGVVSGTVRLRVSSPLSPALMITSAFVFICALFLLSLLFLFVFKKRHHFLANVTGNNSLSGTQTNGTTSLNGTTTNGNSAHRLNGARLKEQTNGTNGTSESEKNGKLASTINGTSNGGLLQTANGQSRGVVNGTGSGLANGAANPNSNSTNLIGQDGALLTQKTSGGGGGLMSMASSDSSCTNDQKQLLASSSASNTSSDRNSSAASSTNGVLGQLDFGVNVSSGGGGVGGQHTDRSTANSSPSSTPMNHISVDDELQLNGSYQATESVTRGAQLSPRATSHTHHSHLMGTQSGPNGGGALIYANIGDYAQQQQQAGLATRQVEHQMDYTNANYIQDSPPGQASTLTLRNSRRTALQRQQTPSEQHQQQQQLNSPGRLSTNSSSSGSPNGAHLDSSSSSMVARPSVGATIAMMNSLAAAAATSPTLTPSATSGVLNGAINQQLANNRTGNTSQVRRPGPPKPPKPSIQQRSRFYQQQVAAATNGSHGGAGGGGLVMIGNSQLSFQQEGHETQTMDSKQPNGNSMDLVSANDLAVEYSRLAFPARAEL